MTAIFKLVRVIVVAEVTRQAIREAFRRIRVGRAAKSEPLSISRGNTMQALDYYVEYKLTNKLNEVNKDWTSGKYEVVAKYKFPDNIANVPEVVNFDIFDKETGEYTSSFTTINKPVIKRSINRTWIDVEIISVNEKK